MPVLEVIFYKDDGGTLPVLDWLEQMGRRDQRIVDKCRVAIDLLASMGHELQRPQAAYLRDDIFELRIHFQRVNYRILYFFYERTAAIVAHGLTKEAEVPDKDINLAIERRKKFIANPKKHQELEEEEQDDENDQRH